MLLAGPGGAFVGARLGPTQMLKSAIPQIAVGAGILMFTPLGWASAAIDEGLAVRIEELRNQLAALLENRNRDRAEMERSLAELDAMETQLDALDDGIADLLAGPGPAVPAPRQG